MQSTSSSARNNFPISYLDSKMTFLSIEDESDDQRDVDIGKEEDTALEDDDDEDDEDEDDSGNEDDEDFLSEELNLPETDDDLESDAVPDYPVIMDDSDEDRIFKRQLAYPPVPQYNPPQPQRQPPQPPRGRLNPRDKLGVLTPMEEVTEPPSSAATSLDGDHRSLSRRGAGSRNAMHHLSPAAFTSNMSAMEQKSILKSRENLQDSQSRRVTFEGGNSSNQSVRSASPADSLTSEYSSMNDSARRPQNNSVNETAKTEIQHRTIVEVDETEDAGTDNRSDDNNNNNNKAQEVKAKANSGKPARDLGMISDMEQGEKVIHWQMENAKSENGNETTSTIDTEFPSIVNGIIAELHNLDELLGSSYTGAMEMNASKQDHLANVSTQLATYLAQVSPQTILTNLPQVIPLVTTLLYLTGSNFRSQLASLTAVNVFIERLRDCKAHSGLKVLPNADLTWLLRALCEISSESSRSVLKNEGVLALARLIKTAGPEMVFEPILFILMGNDEKVRKKRKENDDEDRIVIPTGGPGGAPKIKATALDALTFALLTFPRDDFDLELVAKLGCHCLLHKKRRMRQASLECLSVVSHALGTPIALPMFRQVIMEEEEDMKQESVLNSNSSISSDASLSNPGSASSEKDAEVTVPPQPKPPSRIPVPTRNDKGDGSNGANPLSPAKLRATASPIAAVSARISRHLLPTPSLNDLVEYAVRIPASSKLLSRQNLAVSRQGQEDIASGDSGESGGSANVHGRRITSSSGTSSSSVTNVEIELEPVLNTIGSGRKKQANEFAGSVIAADVSWILAGSGPIKACDGASVLAPIFKLPDKELISDMNITQTHLRQFGMIHSSGMESDSNSSDIIGPEFAKLRRGSKTNENGSNSGDPSNSSNGNQTSSGSDPNMNRYYSPNPNYGMGRGMAMTVPPDNNNSGRNQSFSLLPNKYSLAGNGMGGRPGNNGMHNGGGVGGDMMVPPHHIPGTYDFSYGSPVDPMDGYSSAALNSSDPYDQPPLRAPSRSKMVPLQPVNSLRQKYFDSSLGNKGGYSDDDGGINDGSDSSASSDEDDDMHQVMKQENIMKAERRASQVSNKSSQRVNKGKDNRKSGKGGKSKSSPKKSQKEGKAQHGSDEPDKVEQIVNRLQQEYQVYRVDRVELDQTGPSPEELAAAAKKKRGELDSAGSNSRDSGVSIGAGSVGSVHTPLGESTAQQQPSVTPLPPENNSVLLEQPENLPTATNNGNSGGKKESSERTSKRKSSIKSSKKSSSNLKVVHHPIETDDGLSRNWKSTPDVSLIDDYDPHVSPYRRLSTEQTIGGGVLGHDITSSSYHNHASTIGGGDSFMMLHRKPVLAGRRQSLGRPLDDLERQLSVIPQQQQMRSSRMDYHQLHHHPQNGYAGVHEQDHFHRVSSMLDMDKVPSRESSAGSGNTYLLHQDSALHHPLSPHLRSSKSTGNLLGVEDPYRPRGNPYLEMMDHPGSPGRRMLHSRLGSHHNMVDLGNSTDDMEFPMTPQSESSSNTLPKQSRSMMGGRNPKIVPKKIYKGSFREVNARGKAGNMSSLNGEMFPLDLKPVTSPKHALPAALLQIQASDWETNVDGFRQLVRIARHHPEFIRSDLHNVNMNALRHVMNLRSQVCRGAILFFRELFMTLGKAMEHDSERIAEKLLDKAADTNKFIREDIGKSLEALVLHVSPAKALSCLDLFGTRHRNPAVRSMTARMTNKLIDKLGPDRCLSEVPERLLPMLCRFLQEGSLDTRMSAKLAFSALMESSSFDAQLKRHVPADTLRHVQKSMKAITTKS
ncbi:unnamed protein product [Orchesella dallaii]|uniref:TOG domain-containing protein n=1 Tax=Orchesella dallaii TaxID=48710 RepID=A0ABP1QW35_9HEXA